MKYSNLQKQKTIKYVGSLASIPQAIIKHEASFQNHVFHPRQISPVFLIYKFRG